MGRRPIEIELNASDDNPIFDVGGGRVRSGGNFYAGHAALAMDALKIAVANVSDLIDRQLARVVDEKFNVACPRTWWRWTAGPRRRTTASRRCRSPRRR